MTEEPPMSDADDDDLTRALEAALVDGPDRTPPPDRVADVRARAAAKAEVLTPTPPVALASRRPGRRDLLIGGIAASIGAAVGAAGVFAGATDDGDDDEDPPTEAITFATGAAAPDGVRTDAALINHTWGVELMLDVEGLAAGTRYDVTYAGADGETTAAGSFLAVDVPMRCRFNAARLRGDTTSIAVTGPDGVEALRAELA